KLLTENWDRLHVHKIVPFTRCPIFNIIHAVVTAREQVMRCFRHILFSLHLFFCSCVVLVALLTCPASAERRVAFVFGNGAYRHATMLPNPAMDAKAIAALLRNVGFDVTEGIDLDRAGMTARLSEFAVKTQGADAALFFYAGHGIAVNGKNYLIP